MKRGFLQKHYQKTAASNRPTKKRRNQPKPVNQLYFVGTKSGAPEDTDLSRAQFLDLSQLDRHEPPPSAFIAAGGERRRFVFRFWPRDPAGGVLRPSCAEGRAGKQASNGLELWGATLYDFYQVRRIPSCAGYCTMSTGSRLAAAMREMGEVEWAREEMVWAEEVEEEPREVVPFDIGRLVRMVETMVVAKWKVGPKGGLDKKAAKEGVAPRVVLQGPWEGWSSSSSSEPGSSSLFDRENYPAPWPLVPFSMGCPRLQQRIPYHLLPQKLVVHDPGRVLFVRHSERQPADWGKDIVRHYTLRLSRQGRETAKKDRDRALKAFEDSNNFIFICRKHRSQPPIVVSHPPRPRPPEETEEAHLFLSPDEHCGQGSHSQVYRAEWELPRSMLVVEQLCESCLLDKVDQELGSHGGLATGERLAAPDVRVYPNAKVEFDSEHIIPRDMFTKASIMANEAGIDIVNDNEDKERASSRVVTINEAVVRYTQTYTGPIVLVHAEADWLKLEGCPGCSHGRKVPRTAKTMVAAKLSIGHDRHLERETKNYQAFPPYLFEHYNGYNIVPPLLDPVPVGAVLPQFYGYYVPEVPKAKFKVEKCNSGGEDGRMDEQGDGDGDGDEEEEEEEELEEEEKQQPYLSPILLIEDCGTPLDPSRLDMDDKQECASLLFRFHHAGWVHHSFADRNVMVQNGPLTASPIDREGRGGGGKSVRSFRLIDFGRSGLGSEWERAGEEVTAGNLLGILHYRGQGN